MAGGSSYRFTKGSRKKDNDGLAWFIAIIVTVIVFSVVPELAKKFINGHYDSVDFTAIIMLIEEELSQYDIVFNTTLFEI